MWNVVETWLFLSKKHELRMVDGEGIRLIEAIGIFGHHFSEMQILLGTIHRVRVSTSGVCQSEQIEQAIADQPRQADDLMLRLITFQQERRPPMITNQTATNVLSGK